MKCSALLAGLLTGGIIAHADTLRLTSGQSLTGRVTGYGNIAFTVEDASGKVTKLPAPLVMSIAFDNGSASGTLDVRNKGKLECRVSLYEKGAFSVEDEKGVSQNIPAIMIASASFGSQAGASEQVKVIAHGGKVDLNKYLVRGSVTILDFYADWCGPCRQFGPVVEKLAKEDPDVVLRKVDIVRWGTPVTQQFSINAIPHVQVYGKAGKLVGEFGGGNTSLLKELIAKGKTQ